MCEFCGEPIRGEPITIKVEGALLQVCHRCTQYGNIVKSPITRAPVSKSLPQRGSRRTVQRVGSKKPKFKPRGEQAEVVLIGEYGERIRSARMKMKLTQVKLANKTGISTAQIQSFESQKIRPTDAEAKKLERELKIKLFEEMDITTEFSQVAQQKKTTFGDIVNIKHYRKDND